MDQETPRAVAGYCADQVRVRMPVSPKITGQLRPLAGHADSRCYGSVPEPVDWLLAEARSSFSFCTRASSWSGPSMLNPRRPGLPEKWANPALLRWARLQVGLEPEHVESHTEGAIQAREIIDWEAGDDSPSLSDLEILADTYACPVGYFFLEIPPHIKPPLEYRGLAPEKTRTLSYETRLRVREFARLTEQASMLTEILDIPDRARIEPASLEEPVREVAMRERERFGFTEDVRRRWMSNNDAFDFWRSAIESRGVFVVALKLNTQEVRGASRWEPTEPPAILVNREDIETATGRTFTLLHEWAHLLVKHPGIVCDFRGARDAAKLETFANRFAAEMMVSKDDLGSYLKKEGLFERKDNWSDSLLEKIKSPFKASRDVIAILLEEMNLAPAGFYHRKRAMWDSRKPSSGGLPPSGSPRPGRSLAQRKVDEMGPALSKLLVQGYARGELTKLDLAELLDVRVEQAQRFVEWVQGRTGAPA